MHSGHYISIRVAAFILHDSWRATVFLLHVPFYGHQLGAYNVFHVEIRHRLFFFFLMKHRNYIKYFPSAMAIQSSPQSIHPSISLLITVVVSLTSSSRILAPIIISSGTLEAYRKAG